jgi:hypothetical protein
MTMYDLYLLTDKDLPQDRERAEYGRKGGASIYDPVRQMVDLNAVRKVSDACTRWRVVGMGDDNHTVAAVDQFLILSALYTLMIHLLFGRVACSLDHLQTTAGIYGFQRLLVADRRNRISYYTS